MTAKISEWKLRNFLEILNEIEDELRADRRYLKSEHAELLDWVEAKINEELAKEHNNE